MSRTLVFEIGVEEVPSAPLYDAVEQLGKLVPAALKDARLGYGDIAVYGAPRRLVVVVSELAERQEDLSMRAKGPAVKAAFDADGNLTQAAIGFARGKGVEVADLVRETEAGNEYVYAVIERAGADASEVLPELLSGLVTGIEWVKSQRWGSGSARFIRPVRWLLALHGADVVPATFAGLTAGRVTYGHRFLSPGPIDLPNADDYAAAMRRGHVVFDQNERARLIREGVEAAAAAAGGKAVVPEKTFAEVVNLVEWPSVVVGHFDEAFLSVPREVVETAMTKHQRYFPVERADGTLANAFVVVHNGDPARGEAIVAGHERVIRARLSDAAFFWDEDVATPMESWVERLTTIVFHEKLGTLAAKVGRVEALTAKLASSVAASPADEAHAKRAAHLAKADLVSHVVIEFPVLQGIMGRHYALAAGEAPEVAQAIVDHYRPRFAGDALPADAAGMLVAAADKLDTIAGIFAIGQGPTGSSDPYALRRAAIGVLAMVLDGGLNLQLDEAIPAAVEGYGAAVVGLDVKATADAVSAFFTGRLEGILRERGHAYDTVAAVLDVAADDPSDALARCAALTAFRGTETGADLLTAFKRAANLADASKGDSPDPSAMGPEETALYEAVTGAGGRMHTLVENRQYDAATGLLAALRGPVDSFFDKVLVMDPDAALRDNRLRLLNRVVGLFEGFATLSLLEG